MRICHFTSATVDTHHFTNLDEGFSAPSAIASAICKHWPQEREEVGSKQLLNYLFTLKGFNELETSANQAQSLLNDTDY